MEPDTRPDNPLPSEDEQFHDEVGIGEDGDWSGPPPED